MLLPQLLEKLAGAAAELDRLDSWPQEQFQWLAEANVLRWVIPVDYGGQAIASAELTRRYVELASACLATTFILTQRNGACQRLAGSENEELKQRLLPGLADGTLFATVGISHLTTSRQHLGRPAVEVMERPYGYVLDGFVPWVTGAEHADYIVTGGTIADGRQVLIALPRQCKGVTVREHAQLLSLTSSHTASIDLNRATVPPEFLIAGPVEGVMQQGQGGGAGSLVTSALALGLSRRALDLLSEEAARRPDVETTLAAFGKEFELASRLLNHAAEGTPDELGEPVPATLVRQRANSLALRLTQACLAVSKGAGFVRGHPAERAVREAMFFLVWSCPQPVVAAALAELACSEE